MLIPTTSRRSIAFAKASRTSSILWLLKAKPRARPITRSIRDHGPNFERVEIDERDLITINYTSGTTLDQRCDGHAP